RRRQSKNEPSEIGIRPQGGGCIAVQAPRLPNDVVVPACRAARCQGLAIEDYALAQPVVDRLDKEIAAVGQTLDAEPLERSRPLALEVGLDADGDAVGEDLAGYLAVDETIMVILRIWWVIWR